MKKYIWIWVLCIVVSICSTVGAIFAMVYNHPNYVDSFIIGGSFLIGVCVFFGSILSGGER